MSKQKKVLVIGPSPHSAQGKNSQNFGHRLFQMASSLNEAWYLGAEENPPLDASRDTFFLGESPREMLFFSSLDPVLGNQLNQDILLGAFPRLIKQLEPDIVHVVNPHQLGFEFLWLTSRLIPSSLRIVSFSDASAICSLNSSLVRNTGTVCAGPTPRACSNCNAGTSSSQIIQSLNYLRNSLTFAHRVTVPQKRYIGAFQSLGVEVVLGPQVDLIGGTEIDLSSSTPPLIKLAYFGPMMREGARMVAEAVRIVSKDTSSNFQVDMFPTDLNSTEYGEFAEKIIHVSNLNIQSNWNEEFFLQYVSDYQWLILPNIESNRSVQWACAANTSGVPLIAPAGLAGLGGKNDGDSHIELFLEGSSTSLAQAIARVIKNESVTKASQNKRSAIGIDFYEQINELYSIAI